MSEPTGLFARGRVTGDRARRGLVSSSVLRVGAIYLASRLATTGFLSLAVLATAVGFSWPLIAAWSTGKWNAYLQTELSWRRLWVGDEGEFAPLEGWFQAGDYWFREWGLDPVWVPAVILGSIAAVAVLLLWEPHVRRLGVEVRLWAASYLMYLLAVFLPQSSLFRLLFPLSPLWRAMAQPRSIAWRIGRACHLPDRAGLVDLERVWPREPVLAYPLTGGSAGTSHRRRCRGTGLLAVASAAVLPSDPSSKGRQGEPHHRTPPSGTSPDEPPTGGVPLPRVRQEQE